VPDAPAIVRHHAHYVTRAAGGRGAVREVSELILHAQGKLAARIADYSEK
jgi:3-deoxy-D-manno-octulosonate 8-phosphate phosphatase (KDO 8-P phosphatase)